MIPVYYRSGHNVLQELCGSTGGFYTAGDLNSYNYEAETVPDLLSALEATGKPRVGFENSKKLSSEAYWRTTVLSSFAAGCGTVSF